MSSLGYDREVGPRTRAWKSIAGEKLFRPVVAVGRGGSGTRLLGSLLMEMGVFLGNRRNGSIDALEWVGLICEMTIKTVPGRPSVQAAQWRELVLEKAGEILSSGEWDGLSRWGWKLPETTLVVPEIANVFANAQFVHLVRHPVDTCLRRTHRTSRRTMQSVRRFSKPHTSGQAGAGVDEPPRAFTCTTPPAGSIRSNPWSGLAVRCSDPSAISSFDTKISARTRNRCPRD